MGQRMQIRECSFPTVRSGMQWHSHHHVCISKSNAYDLKKETPWKAKTKTKTYLSKLVFCCVLFEGRLHSVLSKVMWLIHVCLFCFPRMTHPKLLDQCMQGWVNNVLFTSSATGPVSSLWCFFQGSLKGESVVAAILSSRMEQSYCTSGFFRFQARFLTSSAPFLTITHYLHMCFTKRVTLYAPPVVTSIMFLSTTETAWQRVQQQIRKLVATAITTLVVPGNGLEIYCNSTWTFNFIMILNVWVQLKEHLLVYSRFILWTEPMADTVRWILVFRWYLLGLSHSIIHINYIFKRIILFHDLKCIRHAIFPFSTIRM